MGKNLRRVSCRLKRQAMAGMAGAIIWLLPPVPSLRSQETARNSACPENLETLTDLMLQDLPAYANRVRERSRRGSNYLRSYVIVTGKPEFEPIPLKNSQYTPFNPDSARQVFFTTLERQYSQDRAVDMQNFYWLFLAQTESGWRLVTLYGQLASLKPGVPPLPPREMSEGAIGQAIGLWLRDCRAGTLRTRPWRPTEGGTE